MLQAAARLTCAQVRFFAPLKSHELNFSFSGVKTSILYFLRDRLKENENFIKGVEFIYVDHMHEVLDAALS